MLEAARRRSTHAGADAACSGTLELLHPSPTYVTGGSMSPTASENVAQEKPVGVTDIEFRGELIYFLVVDRFFDGDPNNNTGQDPKLYDPERQDYGKYWGGDIEGVVQKLDYLEQMGVTAVWLTPLFEQIEAMVWDSAPIHGYWTRDFKRIHARWVSGEDEVRFFTRDDTTLDRLIEGLHARGMKMVLDIVCNHSSPDASGVKGQLFDDGRLIADFHNDVDNWYHHYGPVTDWQNDWQVKNCELAGLATFNENNVAYRNYVKSAIKSWLQKGVDALRIDTVKHMPLWFWQEFTSDMVSVRPDVFMFGEWIYSHPMNQESVDFANLSGMSILDFGLCVAIREALGTREPAGFQRVTDVLDQDGKYRSATELVTFFENHDMPRLQSIGADETMLRLALVLIMTCRGIPCVYYGCEQGLHDDTNGGNDPYNRPMMTSFDTDAPLYQAVKKLAHVRKQNISVQFGSSWTKYLTPDVFCFSRRYRDARCFVALNRGEPVTLARVLTDLPDGSHTCALTGRTVSVRDGEVSGLELGHGEALVCSFDGSPTRGDVVTVFQVNGCPTAPGDIVAVIGNAPELGEWDVAKAFRLEYINSGTWQGGLAFAQTAGQQVTYKYMIIRDDAGLDPPRRENRTTRRRVVPETGTAKWRDIWEE
jgi:cyclomaltodextrin glucanotransferase